MTWDEGVGLSDSWRATPGVHFLERPPPVKRATSGCGLRNASPTVKSVQGSSQGPKDRAIIVRVQWMSLPTIFPRKVGDYL